MLFGDLEHRQIRRGKHLFTSPLLANGCLNGAEKLTDFCTVFFWFHLIVGVRKLILPADLQNIAGIRLVAVNVEDRLDQRRTGQLIDDNIVVFRCGIALCLAGRRNQPSPPGIKVHVLLFEDDSRKRVVYRCLVIHIIRGSSLCQIEIEGDAID